ncbi:MAG: thioesterase family protein [Solirubrobacteraceae bacterium]|nr:thioesterase family protein [Solirubrobacteraceae bacterium]
MSTDPTAEPPRPDVRTAFERATAVVATADGRYVGDVDDDWSAPTGPNGGYLAAIAVRALVARMAGEGSWRLRSLTCHYLRRARNGPIELRVDVIRAGRRTASARLTGIQEGRETIAVLAAFTAPGLAEAAAWGPSMPDVAPPPDPDAEPVEAAAYRRRSGRWIAPFPQMPPIVQRVRVAPQLGGVPFAGRPPEPGAAVETGGWIALAEPQRIDVAALVFFTDIWWPPAFDALSAPAVAPTIELTVHVRCDVPDAGLPHGPVLGHYRSPAAVGGLVDEDASVFLPDGTLAVQSRQISLLAPVG